MTREKKPDTKSIIRDIKRKTYKKYSAEEKIKNFNFIVQAILQFSKQMEDNSETETKYTQLLPDGKQKIPYSRILRIMFKLLTHHSKSPDDDSIPNLFNKLFNIVELRQLLINPPENLILFPEEMQNFLDEKLIKHLHDNEYVDISEIMK